jgi:hypothetical protein
MPCGLCGDIIPTEVVRCPACGAWSRRRDFRALGIGVFMLLGFNAFMAMGSAVSLMRTLPELSAMTRSAYDPVLMGRTLDTYGDVFIITGALAAVTGLLFVAWLWRAHDQAAGPLRHRRGWVLAGWLLPVANLWMPPRVIHDIWTSSARFRLAERHAIGTLIAAWWSTLLAAIGLGRLFQSAGAETISDARLAVQLGVASTALQAIAATLCMGIVFYLTRVQVRH